MPKARKEVFHPCTIETMHIIIFLLVVTQFLTTNLWHGSMDAGRRNCGFESVSPTQGAPKQRGQNQKWLPHPGFSGARKRAEVLRHTCILGVPNKGDKIRSGCLTLPFSGLTNKI